MGLGHVAIILGVVALILGGSGLAIALTHTGPTGGTGANGAQGTRGPEGPAGANGTNGTNGTNGAPGPGALVNGTTDSSAALVNGSCEAYAGSEVNFTVSGPGTLVITAAVELSVVLDTGEYSNFEVSVANTTTGCNIYAYSWVAGAVPAASSSESAYADLTVVQTFFASSAGQLTTEVIDAGYTTSPGYAEIDHVTVVGVFYPS